MKIPTAGRMLRWFSQKLTAGDTAKHSDDSSSISSVYSLAVQHEALWLLSGLESGGINLQSVRHDEGKQIACLRGHTSAVSVLNLASDERSLLSGSWDRTVLDWDLNTGNQIRSFEGSGGQISALAARPLSSLPVPETSGDLQEIKGTLSSDSANVPRSNGAMIVEADRNGQVETQLAESKHNGSDASPVDSLFGGNDTDSLFGDRDNIEVAAPSGGTFADDEDDEFSRAIANGIREQEQEIADQDLDAEGDIDMANVIKAQNAPSLSGEPGMEDLLPEGILDQNPIDVDVPPSFMHTDYKDMDVNKSPLAEVTTETGLHEGSEPSPTIDSTFLAASIDGSLRVWDKRQPTPVAKMSPQNVPPWCMNACWSPDGNFIYAGRRNGTVDEYSLHKGMQKAERSFKLPNNSGAVSAVRAMPNGRHLIW